MSKPRRLVLAVDRDPWERQPGEGERAYAHFAMYRDLGRARTLAQAAELLAVNRSYLRTLAGAHHFVDRAAAFDRETDRLYAQRMAAARRDMAEQDARLANSFLAKAIEKLRALAVSDMSPADLVRFAEFATKLRRTAFGADVLAEIPTQPAPVGEAYDDGVDYDALTPEQRLTRMIELHNELGRRIDAGRALV